MDSLTSPGRLLVLDTETTGLSTAARIVELAAIEVEPRTGKMRQRLHTLIDPEMPIPPVVTAIHGIRDRDVAGKPAFRALADRICSFLGGATVIAQNASFDRRMLEVELARSGRPPLAALGVQMIDTLAAARGLFPLLPAHTLDAICDELGVDRTSRRRHGALVDAELVAQALPGMAAAYDAWNACDDGVQVPAHAVAAALRLFDACGAHALGAERAERAFVLTAAAANWARRREDELLERLECLVPLDGWCSKHHAALWTASDRTSYKDAALAYLSDAELAAFRSESRAQYLVSLPDTGAGLVDRLEDLEPAFDDIAATNAVPALVSSVVALRAARGRLDAQRAALRETLLLHASEGYRLRSARLDERPSVRTDYRGALQALAPSANLRPFVVRNDRLQVTARDLSHCAALFGSGNAQHGRVA